MDFLVMDLFITEKISIYYIHFLKQSLLNKSASEKSNHII